MLLGNQIRNFINDSEFKITLYLNRVNIVNYTSIEHFDDYKIIIKINNKKVIIGGVKLGISKLLNDEVLITGQINDIRLENNEK